MNKTQKEMFGMLVGIVAQVAPSVPADQLKGITASAIDKIDDAGKTAGGKLPSVQVCPAETLGKLSVQSVVSKDDMKGKDGIFLFDGAVYAKVKGYKCRNAGFPLTELLAAQQDFFAGKVEENKRTGVWAKGLTHLNQGFVKALEAKGVIPALVQ